MAPLHSYLDRRLDLPNLLAVDTETQPFRTPTYGWKAKTRTSPPDVPALILGSVAGDGGVSVHAGLALIAQVAIALEQGYHLVFHNCAFDIPVLCAADPRIRPLLLQAVDECRIHDTMLLEVLLQIARSSRTIASKNLVKSPTLDALALRRCGLRLVKDDAIRLTFNAVPPHRLSQAHLAYAAADAQATYLVYKNQLAELPVWRDQECRYPVFPDAEARFGPLSENIQVKGALAFAWLEQFPFRVDLPAAGAMRDRYHSELPLLEEALISYGLARRTPKSKKFSVSLLRVRAELEDFAKANGILPERTNTNLISTEYDFWAAHLPKIDPETVSFPSLKDRRDRLAVWLRYLRVQRLLARYIYPLASAELHYPRYWNIGARTTRSAASTFPIQQLPKRSRDSLRHLIIPADGRHLIEGDFNSAELVALAEVYEAMFGGSALGRGINAGESPHVTTARRLRSDFDTLPDADRARLRQAAKAINFGLPGGLGSKRFGVYCRKSYGLKLTDEEAADMRQAALQADPELRRYLEDTTTPSQALALAAKNLGMTVPDLYQALRAIGPDGEHNPWQACRRLRDYSRGALGWEIDAPPGFDPRYDLFKGPTRTLTGFIRGNASFCEAHNMPFQGLVAGAMKIALYNLMTQWYHDTTMFAPVTSVHDSILIQSDPARADEARRVLHDAMIAGIRAVAPSISGKVDLTDYGTRWST